MISIVMIEDLEAQTAMDDNEWPCADFQQMLQRDGTPSCTTLVADRCYVVISQAPIQLL